METITLADYIQYGFMAFIGLLLVALLVAVLRQARDVGELKGEVRAVNIRIDDVNTNLSARIDDLNTNLSARIDGVAVRVDGLEATVAARGREISEVKGLLVALHERVDLVMRHRHDPDNGQVVLTPEEVAAD